MPFDSQKFLQTKQIQLLLDHLELLNFITEFENDAIKDGKNPPPRPPPSRPLTTNAFINLLAAREGVVIIGNPSTPPTP